MQLQPRQVSLGELFILQRECQEALTRALRTPVAPEPLVNPRLSIWRMELPNTSYWEPQAAFWWVSNEVKR